MSNVAYALKRVAQASILLAVVTGCSTATTTIPAVAAGDGGGRDSAIVVDANTGRTLYASKADAQRYPASLTKMMTMYMLFEAMHAGRVNRDTRIPVSAYAASRPPTKIGFRPGQTIRAEDAVLAMVTKSANDAATAVGEYLGGSEERFAQMMTAKARRLGMRNTTFRNASGLPNMAQHSSARDMAILGMALRQHFPREFAYFSRRSFVYRGHTIRGHNRLLGKVAGVDGIKTGYTNASGFNLVSSVNLDGRRLVAVVMGGASGASRDAHMAQLIHKYLPMASRGRVTDPLVAAGGDAPETTAAVAPAGRLAPRASVGDEDNIPVNDESGEGDDDKPQPLALASPASRPVALAAAQAAIRPTPRVPVDDSAEVDPVTTASAPASGGWAIQIGSLPSKPQASQMLDRVAAATGGALRSASPYTETFRKGRATYYRARFVGFQTREAALNACTAVKRKQFHCFAVAN